MIEWSKGELEKIALDVEKDYVLLPKNPSIELLEKFVGRGLMCGKEPHPEVYNDAIKKYERFINYLLEN